VGSGGLSSRRENTSGVNINKTPPYGHYAAQRSHGLYAPRSISKTIVLRLERGIKSAATLPTGHNRGKFRYFSEPARSLSVPSLAFLHLHSCILARRLPRPALNVTPELLRE
jgi:hypothetical protein